jgi:HK97 family phage prohead protease
MPYGISDTQSDCSGWATVKQNSDGSYETLACHDTKQDAIDQMVAVSLAEDVEPLGEVGRRAEGEEILVIDLDETLVTKSREPLRAAVDAVNAVDMPVFIVTGREEAQRETTLEDLAAAGIDYDALYMMPEIDMVIADYKRETVAMLMQEGYVVTAFVDDNSDNIAAVKTLGVPTMMPDEFVAAAVTEVELELPDEPDEEPEVETESRAVNVVAPVFMARSAERGLRLHEQGLSGDGLVPATVADARRMANGEALSERKWRRIPGWIARHMMDLDAVEGDEITPGLVAMLLWGGGSNKTTARRAQAYAERVVAQLDADSGERKDDDIDYTGSEMNETMQVRWISDTVNENRSVAYTTLEVRAEGDSNTLVGYASVFDSPSEPMPFVEYVRKGAFAKTLNDGADVRLLIDHEGVPLARTKSRTLMLEEDDRGLRVEATLDPLNPDAQRVLSAMRRGDLSQMSFAFRTVKDSWNSDRTIRELKEVQLFDVSVVTYPAYEDTVVSLRSRQDAMVDVSSSLSLRQRQIQIARQR